MADATDTATVRTALFKRYLVMLAPAAILFGGWAACRQAGLAPVLGKGLTELLGQLSFIGAIVLAVAAPLLYRARFVRSVAGRKSVAEGEFLAFQRALLSLALLAPYAAAVAYVTGASNFHFGGAFLAALYAAYYYFPSQRRVSQEMRLFRVTADGEA